MKREMTPEEVQKIDDLNNKLIALEEKIYHFAEAEYLRGKAFVDDTSELDIEVFLIFYTNEEKDEYDEPLEIIRWHEPVYVESFERGEPFGINDKQCHNVSGSFIDNKALNRQKHCWLLHRLYDDFFVDWEDILRIDGLYYDINLSYQYVMNFNEVTR